MNFLEKSLSDIATELPGATAIFNQHHLDFCCGGKTLLGAAMLEKGLDEKAIEASLQALSSKKTAEKNWSEVSDSELIDHLVNRYHQVHRAQLPELIRLAERVETVHSNNPLCPLGLAAQLKALAVELEQHMQKEEQILFPLLASGHRDHATGPMSMMRHEHDDHALALSSLTELSHGITLPENACNTWRALYLGLEDFIQDIKMHIHLENNVLFEAPLIQDVGAKKSHGLNTCCGSCGG